MPADVIINPTSGEIYWNDNTGSPQSISLRGDAQNKIDIIGYGASFSAGGGGIGTFVIATFNDSLVPGTSAFVPGTSGNDIGSAILRWKTFLTSTNISDSSASLGTNSTSLLSGLVQVNGGIAISGNASIGRTVLFFINANPIYFVGITAPASLASTTTYFLPTNYPGTGTSILQSDTVGNLTWVPLAASSAGSATTAQNVQVSLVGNSNIFHSVLLTPTIAGAGSAVSGNGTLVYNTQSDILTTPGLAVTSGAVSTSTTSGAFQVKGGFGITGNAFIGGTINVASPITIPNGGTNASSFGQSAGFVYYDGVNVRLLAATGATINYTNGYYQFDNRVYATSFFANNSQMPNGSGAAGRITIWSGNNTIASDAEFTYDATNNILAVLGNINGIGLTISGIAATSTLNATSTTSAAMVVTGGLALGGNAIIGGSTIQSGVSWINNNTNATSTSSAALYVTGGLALGSNAFIGGTVYSTSTAWFNNTTPSISTSTGTLIVTGGVGIGGSLNVTTSVPSSISGIYVANGVLSGSALTATASLTTTNIRTSASTLNIVDSGTTNTFLNYNGSRLGVLIAADSTASNNGGLVTTGGAGFGASINVNGNIGVRSGFELRIYNPGDTAFTGFNFSGTTSTTYILPLAAPAIGNSVLQSSVGGVMSWVPMAAGGGSPGGNNTELQFNNGGTFGGATGVTYQSTTYLVSIASTADQRAVTTVGLRLVNNAAVSIAGVQQRFSPALEIAGRTVTTPNIENFNRFVTEVVGTISSYGAQQQWKYSLDTGTPSYTNPVFVIHSQKGVGIGYTGISFQNFFRASVTQAVELTYVLPVAYPGTGSSVLSSNTTGDLSWVPMTTGGSGTPGGSNRQIQYNNSSAFGGAAGFEYVSAGNAVTVNIFATAGGGLTSGLSINTINGTTTRIGIGLTNPAFELEIRGEISATNKSFVIDHPTKPGMKLRYGSLEGPENGVYVRGQLLGTNIIETPDYWRGLVHNDSCTIHLTPIGNYQQLYVEKIQDYKVYVGTASTFEINCFYSVWAERKDISKLTVEY